MGSDKTTTLTDKMIEYLKEEDDGNDNSRRERQVTGITVPYRNIENSLYISRDEGVITFFFSIHSVLLWLSLDSVLASFVKF